VNNRFMQTLLVLAIVCIAGPLFAEGGEHAVEAAHNAHGAAHFPWDKWAWNMVNFLVFAGVLWKYALPAMQSFFAKRREELVSEMNAAKALRLEAKAQLERFEDKLKDLEKERQSIMDEYHEQGERERDRLIVDAKKQVEKMRVDAEMIISQETRKAVSAIEKQAVDEAIGLAMTKLTTKMSDHAQNGLVSDFVDELRAMD